jgi:hypothetical protein
MQFLISCATITINIFPGFSCVSIFGKSLGYQPSNQESDSVSRYNFPFCLNGIFIKENDLYLQNF